MNPAMTDNPILEAFRARFVRNPEVNDLTPFGFFEAGPPARDTQVMMLRESLIAIADAAPSKPSHGRYVGRAGAFIHSLQATASMALGRPKSAP